jgi:hypothetical protein
MPLKMYKEKFVGKYNGVVPATLLPPGWISGGVNIRKVSGGGGGWKVRKGCALHNTTAAQSGTAIKSLHQYTNPRSLDYHFLAQCNSKLLKETAAAKNPPAVDASYGTDLGVTVGTSPGVSCVVEEDLFYADGSGRPIVWGGNTPYCLGWIVYDGTDEDYNDYSIQASDGRTDTYAYAFGGTDDAIYICSPEIASGIKLTISTANAQTATLKVYSWVNGAWQERSTGYDDGTLSGGKTMAETGTISWTKNATDEMMILEGIMGYWYKLVPQAEIGSTLRGDGISNADIINETCDALGSWIDDDENTGASTQETHSGREVFKFYTNDDGRIAQRSLDIGTIGASFSLSFEMYPSVAVSANYMLISVDNGDILFQIRFRADAVEVYDGSAWNEVATATKNVAYQKWTIDVDSSTPASATCNIYLDGYLVAADADCSDTAGVATDGLCKMNLTQSGSGTNVVYINYFKVGSDQGQITDAPVKVTKCQLTQPASLVTNKWDGSYSYVTGCVKHASHRGYTDNFADVVDGATGTYLALSDIGDDHEGVFLKTPEPATAFEFLFITQVNTGTVAVARIEYFDGNQWQRVTTGIVDGTASGAVACAKDGVIEFQGHLMSPVLSTMLLYDVDDAISINDDVPGYWYKIVWDAVMVSSPRIYSIKYAPSPTTLPTCKGVVEFDGRLFLWGIDEYANRLRYSAYRQPDVFTGDDSGYTGAFGGLDKPIAVVNFENTLVVLKKNSIWALGGNSTDGYTTTRITANVGISSPASVQVSEVGSPVMHALEVRRVLIWQDVDGIYLYDGSKTKKASGAVDQFFNPEYTATAIAAANIATLGSFIDPTNNEYHLLIPGGELVYNYVSDEWYPPWDRSLDLTFGISLKGTDGRDYTYGVTSGGFICKLENDTSDKDAANADVIISHSVKTRALSVGEEEGITFKFTLRRLWAELKARSEGTITTETFGDMASSGAAQATPSDMSMVAAGKTVAVPHLDTKEEGLSCVQIEHSLAAADQEMEIWGIIYEAEVRGEIGV